MELEDLVAECVAVAAAERGVHVQDGFAVEEGDIVDYRDGALLVLRVKVRLTCR